MNNIEKLHDSLSEILSDIKSNNKEAFNKAIIIMNSKEFGDLLQYFIKAVDDNEELDSENLDTLGTILEICNTIYNYSGESTGLTDSEYDELVEYYRSVRGDDEIITQPLLSEDDVSYHKYKSLRGTLDKIYKLTDEDVLKNKSQKTLDDWVRASEKRYFEATGETIDLYEEDVMVMPKFDGVSCVFEFNADGTLSRALTRGDTKRNKAQDITHILKDVVVPPIDNPSSEYGHKTEIMMLNEDLDKYNEEYHTDYKNTRSIVSSILNSDEKDDRVNYLKIIPLRVSYFINGEESKQELSPGIYNYPYLKCKLKELDKIRDFSFNHKVVQPGLRCDGSVIYIINPKVQKALGREHEKQKFEVAFKFTEEKTYSEVTDVEFTTGLFGRINPVVVFKPVKMKGNTVNHASLGSYARFKKLELAKGDTVKVLYDIIPYADFDLNDPNCIRSGKSPIKVPLVCPDCGEALESSDSGDILYCKNKSCPCRERGKILNYLRKMDIANISYATVEDFYNEGLLKTIDDLYSLKDKVSELLKIPGYGAAKINKIINEIENKKTVIPSVLLGSIGIEGLSITTFQSILQFINMKDLIDLCAENDIDFFTTIPGIKEKKATALVNGINNNRELIAKLVVLLDLQNEPKVYKSDFTIYFTKMSHDEYAPLVEEYGGTVDNSFSKKTSLLVIPNSSVTSSKVDKAKKWGTPVITVDELEDYLKNKM